MYINKIHILYQVLFCVLGIISAQIASWCIKRMPEHEKILSKEFFKGVKPNYILIIITVIIYLILLNMYGIKNQFLNNIQLIKYTILTPMLLIAFIVDYKYQIIPNRLNQTIFEVGLIFTFISGMYSMNLITQALLRMPIWWGSIFDNYAYRRTCRRKRGNGIW